VGECTPLVAWVVVQGPGKPPCWLPVCCQLQWFVLLSMAAGPRLLERVWNTKWSGKVHHHPARQSLGVQR